MCFQRLPHPKEKINKKQDLNTNIEVFRSKWFTDWQVLEKYGEFWGKIKIELHPEFSDTYPADTYSNILRVNPHWLSAGILAHEFCHISYSYLTETQKLHFTLEYGNSLVNDNLMKLLDRQNSYMNTSFIEAHAEIGRYLGERIPETLKKYYPMIYT